MLAKLIKYDIKAQVKIFSSMYIFDVILSLFSLLVSRLNKAYPQSVVISGVNTLLFAIFIIGLLTTMFVSLIMVVMRYRNNLLKDEGYLMHTLPVKVSQLYFSKLISSLLWFVADIVVIYFVFSIRFLDFTWITEIVDQFMNGFSQIDDTGKFAIIMISYAGVLFIVSIMQFFAALNLGYSVGSKREGGINKDVLSIIMYIVSYIIIQVISVVGIVISVVSQGIDITKELNDAAISGYSNGVMVSQLIIAIIFGVIFGAVSIITMKKKLNLE